MLDVNYCQFTRSLDGTPLVFLAHPIKTSLYRFKQKLQYNISAQTIPFEHWYYLHLTINDESYNKFCKQEISFSDVLRKFWDKLRSRKRLKHYDGYPLGEFAYASRCERGPRKTERLHFHIIFVTNDTLERVKTEVKRHWPYCTWEYLDEKKCFEHLNSGNLAAVYASKYASKTVKKGEHHIARLRNEIVGRYCNTSRHFKATPEWIKMVFDPDIKIWKETIKDNWRKNKTGMFIYPQYTGELIPPDAYYRWYYYQKLAITSWKRLRSYEDFANEFWFFQKEHPDLYQSTDFNAEEFPIPAQLQEYANYFAYEYKQRPARRYKKYFKSMDHFDTVECTQSDLSLVELKYDQDQHTISELAYISVNTEYAIMKYTDLYYT